MSRVTDTYAKNRDRPIFICDFSPPRGADVGLIEQARHLDVDFICIAYNPGKSVRVDSAITAYAIKEQAGRDVIFNLATRDMNRLALQSRLLGAQMLGLENVVVVKGDPLTERDLGLLKGVDDYKPTELIRAIASMNEGVDFKGLKLRSPTGFCIGASIDLGRDMEAEVRLTQKKASAGAEFFIVQALFDVDKAAEFPERYRAISGEGLPGPVFYGVQILEKDGIIFGDVPDGVKQDLEKGRPGTDIALEFLSNYVERGMKTIYLVPPILRGGRRDYEAAQRVLEAFRR